LKQKVRISFFLVGVLFSSVHIHAQNQTRSGTASAKTNSLSGKIMIVPFEPKLYMSEIDKKVNEQTKWNFNQIRENFRHQLDIQLQQKFKSHATVISFYKDSTKMAKDLSYLYSATRHSYDLIDKPSTAATKKETLKGIKNGQVEVEMNEDKRFFNAIVDDSDVLAYFNKKYNTEYFVFINQLDIKNDPSSYNITTASYQRKVDIHYTIVDKNNNLVAAGIASSNFSSKENNPKKIVELSFAPVAKLIADKFIATITPVTAAPKKQ